MDQTNVQGRSGGGQDGTRKMCRGSGSPPSHAQVSNAVCAQARS